MRKALPRYQQLVWSSVLVQSLTSALQLFVSTKLCGPNCWELSAQFPAAGKQRGRGWAVPVCGIAPHAQELNLQVCPMSTFRQDSWASGRMERQWDGDGRDSVNAAFGPESTSRDGFEADPCICCAGLQGRGTKALGAGTAPACSIGTERAVCCHSPPCHTDACLGCRAEGAGLLLLVPASVCLSVCLLPGAAGSTAGSVLAQLSPAVRWWQGCAGGAL